MTFDVSKTLEALSDQLNAIDLMSGPRIIRIREVRVLKGEQPVHVFYDGDDNKPWKPSKTERRCMAACYTADGAKWIGKHVKIYCDDDVTYSGQAVGGIRLKEAEGLTKPLKLMLPKTRGKKQSVTIYPLDISEVTGVSAPEIDHGPAQTEARESARGGRDMFTEWWKNNADKREAATLIIEELKQLSKEADDNAAT